MWNGMYTLRRDGRVVAMGGSMRSQLGGSLVSVCTAGSGLELEPVAFLFDVKMRRVMRLVCGASMLLEVSSSSVVGGEQTER